MGDWKLSRWLATAVVTTTLGLSACIWDYDDRPIDGEYSLVAIDGGEAYSLCRRNKDSCSGLVGGAIIAIGTDGKFLTVARLPYEIDDAPTPNSYGRASILEYYYIDKQLERSDNRDAVKGPFTEEQFKAEAARLGLPELRLP